jgi:hypothetical protein
MNFLIQLFKKASIPAIIAMFWGRSSVAEHLTLNQGVVGSNPSALTREMTSSFYAAGYFFDG